MNWGVITANVLSALAVVVAYVGVRKADNQAQEAANQALEADALARSSTEAADRSANAVERMAAAMERQAVEAERRDATPGVVWRLEHFQGDAYLLTNAGRAPAHGVAVNAPELLVGEIPKADVLGPNESLKFMAVRTLGTRDDTVTVWWSEVGDMNNRRSWRRPLPPRPSRR